ncbi:MAG: hypothetical protein EOO91_16160 [Pedobacter sp.]|nr:MAG: hypothetical protein EOO91_16160 [Pedobacter sp.]
METRSENSKPWSISKRFFTLLSIYFAFLMVDFTSSDELFPHFVYVFPFPDLIRLTEPYGESTPMGLAWTFVGYSSGYNLFTGGAEVLAGILLFYKRTTLFGSLVAMTVMANVVAMNFAYDIPVKIFSLNLLIMAAWIAWYDKDRLINFFFLNNVADPSVITYPYHTKWKKIVQLSLKSIAILFALYSTLYSDLNMAKEYGDAAPKAPLYGIYDVKTFNLKGELLAPLTTDSTRWKRMIIGYPGYARITKMTDSNVWMKLKVDTNAKTLKFTSTKDSTNQYILAYKKLGKDQLIVKGLVGKDAISIQFKQFDHTQLNLVKTGFHWINEYPNNR